MTAAVVDVVRTSAGRVTAGAATINPTGINQFSATGNVGVRKRLDAAVALEIAKRPECVTSFAEKLADAMKDPEAHLPFLYLCKDRIAPLLPGDEPADSGPPPTSEEQWRELARTVRVETAERGGVIDVTAEPVPDGGAS